MNQTGTKKEGSERGAKKGGSKTNINKQPETEEEKLAREK